MRGKHGAAAERRGEIAALQRRAEESERRAHQAELDRDQAREELRRHQQAARDQIARLIADRDAATGPALTTAERLIDQLRADKAELARELDKIRRNWDRLLRRTIDGRLQAGLTHHEALETILLDLDDDGRVRVQSPSVAGRPTPAAHAAIARARGDYRTQLTASEVADLRTLEDLHVARGRWLSAAADARAVGEVLGVA